MKTLAKLAVLWTAVMGTATAGNWPNWRGPDFNGSAKSGPLPAAPTRDDIVWSIPLPGRGGSTPVVWDDHVFVNAPDESGNLVLVDYNRVDGKERWRRTVGVGDKERGRNNMAAPSPVTDGKTVFTLFGTGDLAAFGLDGRELWKRNLGKDYGRFAVMWIYGSSPLLFGDRLYVQVLQRNPMPADYVGFDGKPERESYLLCLDPKTGSTLWKHVRKTDSTLESSEAYSTPVPYHGANGDELVVVGGDHVSGHRMSDGAENWRARLYEKRDDWYRIVTSPVTMPGWIFAGGPKGQPVVALKDGAKGDVTGTGIVWRFTESPTDWATPLVMNDRLYVLDGGKRVISKLNPKTGEKEWSGKLPGREVIWGSPTGADGKIYQFSEDGTLSVCDAGAEFKVLGSLVFEGEGPCRGSVAVAHDQLFVKTGKKLHCLAVRK